MTQVVSHEPVLQRLGGRLNDEPLHRNVISSRQELAALVDEANEVAGLYWEYQWGLFDPSDDMPGVVDRLGFQDGTLVRRDLSNWTPEQK